MGGIPEAEEALAAAVAAYDHGLGAWPTMTVGDRIDCMQDFTRHMVARAQQIVELIMREIGKNLPIRKRSSTAPSATSRPTIEALKEHDNWNSRFRSPREHWAIRRTPLGVVLCMGPTTIP